MKAFTCHVCQQLIFFENVQCLRCQSALGYLPDVGVLSALEPAADGEWRPHAPEAGDRRYKMCLNYSQERVCNWLLASEDDANLLCLACRFNQTIPDLSLPENRSLWQRLETAKRRLGQPDMYPFVLSPMAVKKLGFVHQVVSNAAQPSATG